MHSSKKIVIIGMGFLMEHIYPCYENFVGKANLAENIIATTADRETIQDKRDRYPFEIILDDNLKALKKQKPDIILFAPPPSVAPELIKGPLFEYFNELRGTGTTLPDIYAFPPSPKGDIYLEILGEDVFVCNILPNMVNEIDGEKMSPPKGNTYVTYPENLVRNKEKEQLLKDFFAPLGGMISVTSDKIMDVLAVLVTIDLWPYRLLFISDLLKIHHKVLTSEPYGNMDMLVYMNSINRAIRRHLADVGLEQDKTDRILRERTALVMELAAKTDKEKIIDNMRNHATKGGVLEKGRDLFDLLLRQKTADYFNGQSVYKNLEHIEKITYESLKIISSHGDRLEGNNINAKVSARHHAGLFALFAKNILEAQNIRTKELLSAAVVKYAVQRGKRMALRAGEDGKEFNFETYMSYGEWKVGPGEIENTTVKDDNPAITRVYRCPWYSEWERLGLEEEGLYYCDNIDINLVKGFNANLSLEVTAVKPEGSSFCEFIWNDTDVNRKFEVDESRRLKSWEYHIAHLYSVFAEVLYFHDEIIEKTKNDFQIVYGLDLDDVFKEFEGEDFSRI